MNFGVPRHGILSRSLLVIQLNSNNMKILYASSEVIEKYWFSIVTYPRAWRTTQRDVIDMF